MQQVVIVGCGVVGAAIAYELSQIADLSVRVIDQQQPAQASTKAALGILMGIISHKVKGRNWRLRRMSMERYRPLIQELTAQTGQAVSFNSDGILKLCFDASELDKWDQLIATRQEQGWQLEHWTPDQIAQRCPQLDLANVVAGIYSPQDGQVNPTELTQALMTASQQRGAVFQFDTTVQGFAPRTRHDSTAQRCQTVLTDAGDIPADWVILASGLGTTILSQSAETPISVGPVLGQAMRMHLPEPVEKSAFQPVITGDDIHIAPLGQGDYWVGATVEFPTDAVATASLTIQPVAERLAEVHQSAIAVCPALADADVVETWSGLRPRPQGRPAPVIEWLSGWDNVLVATAHYRNGVLLAPATAAQVRTDLMTRLDKS